MHWNTQGLWILGFVLAASPIASTRRTQAQPAPIDSAEVRASVFAYMNKAAAAASTLDPVAALAGAPTDSNVIFVSNGTPIRGSEFVAWVGRVFSTLDSMRMTVSRAEIRPLTSNIATATYWLNYAVWSKNGRTSAGSEIETATYERKDGHWRTVLWHKTSLP